MSWDVLLSVVPEGFGSIEELPRDFRAPPIGPHGAVEDALRRAVPTIDLADPSWGVIDGPGWSVEVNIGRADPVDAIMLHIRGGGDDALPVVFRVAGELGCRPLDMTTGELLASVDSAEGWWGFQEYRDKVVREDDR
ncbi:MAG TPA: hypothetical protein VNO31_02285 [Umezawaea sp.]|nr:hypothetical protein [Umezawaea sp.]